MRIGWLGAERNIPVTVGNGVHLACALPEVEWLWISAPERPGHDLVLSETARRDWRRPEVLGDADLGAAPGPPRETRTELSRQREDKP
jgi:hypothetical protein